MKVIHLSYPLNLDLVNPTSIVLALGFFDGVHRAHRKVINTAKEEAQRLQIPLAVMTFNQHPKVVYGAIEPKFYKYVSILPRKIELMTELGVDILYVVDYTYLFGSQSPQEFVDSYIMGLNAEVVVAGFDYTYGKRAVANMRTLVEHARGRFKVVEVSEVIAHNEKIGTSSIRKLLLSGDVDQANKDLGYVYENKGIVIHGQKNGRKFGFPTANLQIDHPQLIPGIGVYAVEIRVGDQWYQGAASIGYNITLRDDNQLSVEVYILDFDQMIYGETVRVRWHHYLRDEIKFIGVPELIEQLKQDVDNTRRFFTRLKGNK